MKIEETEAFNLFILNAIERLSWALLTGDYDTREIEKINNEAEAYIYELK